MLPARAEHIGSLKRPEALLLKRAELELGECTVDELRACEDACIADVVRMQIKKGLPVITDGEYRRQIFYDGVFDRLSGLKVISNPPESIFQKFNFVTSWPFTYICTKKLRRKLPLYGDSFDFLKKVAGSEHVQKLKVTMGAPEWYHFRHGKFAYEQAAYPNDVEYLADVARVYREEIDDLYTRGCRRIQIDDPVLGCFCDMDFRRRMVQDGVDPDELLNMYLDVLSACVRDRPRGMIAGIHICRGNVKPDGTSFARGSYDIIAEKLFTRLDFDCFYLEYDTEHAGGFEPLRYLPGNKRVVLGLVSTKNPAVRAYLEYLEDPDLLRGRIMEAAEAIASGVVPKTISAALDQLAISPQCGFASHSRGFAFVSHEDMVKKLELVKDVARMVWNES